MPTETPIVYRKLPGRGSAGMQGYRLYLGPDHLLQVSTSGFTETYQRFYFADIQAISFAHTKTGQIANGILGVLLAKALFLALPVNTFAARSVFAGLAIAWAGLLLSNVLLGPTCKCSLTTAIQTRRLPSIGRARRARHLINQLRPLIQATQGDLTASAPTAPTALAESAAVSAAPSPASASPEPPPDAPAAPDPERANEPPIAGGTPGAPA